MFVLVNCQEAVPDTYSEGILQLYFVAHYIATHVLALLSHLLFAYFLLFLLDSFLKEVKEGSPELLLLVFNSLLSLEVGIILEVIQLNKAWPIALFLLPVAYIIALSIKLTFHLIEVVFIGFIKLVIDVIDLIRVVKLPGQLLHLLLIFNDLLDLLKHRIAHELTLKRILYLLRILLLNLGSSALPSFLYTVFLLNLLYYCVKNRLLPVLFGLVRGGGSGLAGPMALAIQIGIHYR